MRISRALTSVAAHVGRQVLDGPPLGLPRDHPFDRILDFAGCAYVVVDFGGERSDPRLAGPGCRRNLLLSAESPNRCPRGVPGVLGEVPFAAEGLEGHLFADEAGVLQDGRFGQVADDAGVVLGHPAPAPVAELLDGRLVEEAHDLAILDNLGDLFVGRAGTVLRSVVAHLEVLYRVVRKVPFSLFLDHRASDGLAVFAEVDSGLELQNCGRLGQRRRLGVVHELFVFEVQTFDDVFGVHVSFEHRS